MVDSPTPMSRAASDMDICMTRSGSASTNSAMDLSAGLSPSIDVLIRIRQPAFVGVIWFVCNAVSPILKGKHVESHLCQQAAALANNSIPPRMVEFYSTIKALSSTFRRHAAIVEPGNL